MCCPKKRWDACLAQSAAQRKVGRDRVEATPLQKPSAATGLHAAASAFTRGRHCRLSRQAHSAQAGPTERHPICELVVQV
jgi:hypothetical protein